MNIKCRNLIGKTLGLLIKKDNQAVHLVVEMKHKIKGDEVFV